MLIQGLGGPWRARGCFLGGLGAALKVPDKGIGLFPQLQQREHRGCYEFIGFGDIHGPKPYKFIGFGDIHGPKPYKFIGFGDILGSIFYRCAGSAGSDLPEGPPGTVYIHMFGGAHLGRAGDRRSH